MRGARRAAAARDAAFGGKGSPCRRRARVKLLRVEVAKAAGGVGRRLCEDSVRARAGELRAESEQVDDTRRRQQRVERLLRTKRLSQSRSLLLRRRRVLCDERRHEQHILAHESTAVAQSALDAARGTAPRSAVPPCLEGKLRMKAGRQQQAAEGLLRRVRAKAEFRDSTLDPGHAFGKGCFRGYHSDRGTPNLTVRLMMEASMMRRIGGRPQPRKKGAQEEGERGGKNDFRDEACRLILKLRIMSVVYLKVDVVWTRQAEQTVATEARDLVGRFSKSLEAVMESDAALDQFASPLHTKDIFGDDVHPPLTSAHAAHSGAAAPPTTEQQEQQEEEVRAFAGRAPRRAAAPRLPTGTLVGQERNRAGAGGGGRVSPSTVAAGGGGRVSPAAAAAVAALVGVAAL
eukprot:gene3978-52407_t